MFIFVELQDLTSEPNELFGEDNMYPVEFISKVEL